MCNGFLMYQKRKALWAGSPIFLSKDFGQNLIMNKMPRDFSKSSFTWSQLFWNGTQDLVMRSRAGGSSHANAVARGLPRTAWYRLKHRALGDTSAKTRELSHDRWALPLHQHSHPEAAGFIWLKKVALQLKLQSGSAVVQGTQPFGAGKALVPLLCPSKPSRNPQGCSQRTPATNDFKAAAHLSAITPLSAPQSCYSSGQSTAQRE